MLRREGGGPHPRSSLEAVSATRMGVVVWMSPEPTPRIERPSSSVATFGLRAETAEPKVTSPTAHSKAYRRP